MGIYLALGGGIAEIQRDGNEEITHIRHNDSPGRTLHQNQICPIPCGVLPGIHGIHIPENHIIREEHGFSVAGIDEQNGIRRAAPFKTMIHHAHHVERAAAVIAPTGQREHILGGFVHHGRNINCGKNLFRLPGEVNRSRELKRVFFAEFVYLFLHLWGIAVVDAVIFRRCVATAVFLLFQRSVRVIACDKIDPFPGCLIVHRLQISVGGNQIHCPSRLAVLRKCNPAQTDFLQSNQHGGTAHQQEQQRNDCGNQEDMFSM